MHRVSLVLLSFSLAAAASAQDVGQRLHLPVASGVIVACTGQLQPGAIRNFQGSRIGNTFTLTWDPVAGIPDARYEVVQSTGSGYCDIGAPTVIATVSTTSYTATQASSNVVYAYFVQVSSDRCLTTAFARAVDTFTTTPQKPPAPPAVVKNGRVTFTFPYSDPRTFGPRLLRAQSDGTFRTLDFGESCVPDPKILTDAGADFGSRLPPGVYTYRIAALNNAGTVLSDPITVSFEVPAQIISFTATPTRIRAGQSATLSFVTRSADSVQINGIGAQPPSGTVTVTPTQTTTYTLTAASGSQTVTSSVTIEVVTAPSVSISSFPAALIQATGVGGATSSYAVTNNGGSSTTVTVSQTGTFFAQSPGAFDLAAGATQVVTITGTAQSTANTFDGFATLSGNGVSGLRVPIRLLSAEPPALPLTAKATENRVDVFAVAGLSPSGFARFTNNGPGILTGTVVANVPWIIPQITVVTIQPGDTFSVPFLIDRTQRSDSDSLLGSASGNLSLYYISSSAAGKGPVGNQAAVSTVTISKANVVDTVTPPTTPGAPPPIASGEVALFVAGLGHVTGTVGQFISDFSILNPLSNRAIDDVRLFYTPASATSSADSISASIPLASARAVTVGDAVKTVFGQESLGTLQIRSRDADKLSVNASVFVSSNPAGTFGTTIPVLRSDRGVSAGGNVVITGLRRDSSSHTNLYIQEVQGSAVTVLTEFIANDGATVSTRSDDLGPFGLKTLGSIVPEGAVATVHTVTSGTGRFHAFATPVDDASNDTWAVADWSTIYGYSPAAMTVIPVAGVLQGAGNTFFRTDVAIMNRGSGSVSGTLNYFGRAGENVTKTVSLGTRQSLILKDIVGTFFGAANGSVGYITFTPVTGNFAVTSRTYTTVSGAPATFGTGVPTLGTSAALRRGSVRAIAALEDAAVATVVAQRPATFRTNFGLLETSGSGAKVRVTVKFTFPAGPKVSAAASGSKDYDLAPNQFLLVNGLAGDVLGPARATLGELRNIEADFQVIDGEGAVMVFTSSVDNGTGDSVLRIE